MTSPEYCCSCLLNRDFNLASSIKKLLISCRLTFIKHSMPFLLVILKCCRSLPATGRCYILITSLGRPWLCQSRYIWPKDHAQTTWWVSFLTFIVHAWFRLQIILFLPSPEICFGLHLCRYFLFNIAKKIAPVVVMFLPKNVNLDQLAELSLSSDPPWSLEVRIFFLLNICCELLVGSRIDI